ncbi:AMP-binding protein [Pseudomonas matsuisoli]|uniref:AMP-binding protein n=1 Tax=Pseudomonas matsuisoli TaxID=1515666 RepID=A0A917UZ94_9PSED|nr:AMP-binding protein [Pseudomonas matsuisoli]GGJ99010.1 AMP-binding protein [Pseudomonas matsuisoli]
MSGFIALRDILLDGVDERTAAVGPALERRELVDDALRFAAELQARHIQQIALHLTDAAAVAIALLGAWRAGVRVVMPADLQDDSRTRLLHTVDALISDDQPLDTWLTQAPLTPAPLAPYDACLVLSTSGSTGQPKLIEKRLYQLANEIAALEQQWGAALGDALIVASVSAQHIYGLLFRVLWPLCAGRPFVREVQPYPEYLQQASLGHRQDFAWVTSPALLKRLGDNLDWQALRSVRKVFSSGGPLPAGAANDVQRRFGQPACEIYGSSETGGIGWREGTLPWTPFAGVSIEPSGDGGFLIKSAYLPAGHAEPCADAVRHLTDGRFELLGRLDRIVKLEEKRISLPRLEQALLQHPWVADTRLGVVHTNRAFLGALVALSEQGLQALRNGGRRALTEALRSHLSGHCEALALPRRWRLVGQLPSNSQGKLPQRDVDALLAAERTRQPERLSLEQQDDEWKVTLAVPLDLAHFSGHFATTPILPGVVQVDWVMSLARELMPLPPRFGGLEVLKFQQLVRPGDHILLTLRFDTERSKLYFTFHNGEATCASGRIVLEQAHA